MAFYSPFTDTDGAFITIFDVRHEHLSQLMEKDIQEGYKIEYKKELSDTVKKKIPKILSSFANSSGGWLFVGIDEKSGDIDNLVCSARTDYAQILSQLISNRVSPLPRFEARFLRIESADKGVLVVYIFEGNNPPYVADGTIYVRNGSSTEPVKSQRADIDNLYQKSIDFKERIKRFCKREYYYPMDNYDSNQVVLCNLYIMNTDLAFPTQPHKLHEWAEEFIKIRPNQVHNYMFSNDSIIFNNSRVIGLFQIGIIIELYDDFSAKIHMPIKTLDAAEKNSAVAKLSQITGQQHIDDFLLLDGYSACQGFHYLVQQYFSFLRLKNIDLSSFVHKVEFEEAENSILFFDNSTYFEHIERFGVPYCCKTNLESRPRYFVSRDTSNYGDADSGYDFITLIIHLFASFGIYPTLGSSMYSSSMKNDLNYKMNRQS